ncbi:hypothetical protein [Erysipelothrix aquatica]|uniref:hypothetical protein n=1 Tax=Erysipelothrix aquatica TaxID=2683714 RepID=UPI001357CB41|nr:hypothetical protein [Erysipelothrix aquatica]
MNINNEWCLIVRSFYAKQIPSMERFVLFAGTIAKITGRYTGGRRLSVYSRKGNRFSFLVEEKNFKKYCQGIQTKNRINVDLKEFSVTTNAKLYSFV